MLFVLSCAVVLFLLSCVVVLFVISCAVITVPSSPLSVTPGADGILKVVSEKVLMSQVTVGTLVLHVKVPLPFRGTVLRPSSLNWIASIVIIIVKYSL